MRRALLPIVACLLLGAATFHLSLRSSSPGKDETVAAPLTRVSLTFSGTVNAKLSAVSILSPDSTEVARVPVVAGPKPTMLVGDLPRRLPGGRYLVRWRTAGADGHAVRGAYAFTINPVE